MTPNPSPAPGLASLLYVEDEDNDVLFMRRALDRAGLPLEFHTVCDGDKAVAFLSGEAPHAWRALPDLVLLDLNLPVRSGFEVLEWIRRHPAPALCSRPVAVISSSGRHEDRERARRLGADDYIVKPTSPTQLLEILLALWARWLSPEARMSIRRRPIPATTAPAATNPAG
jgi:Response regulators consisting of a CheY-like receiver domain and a winged-helix DNA-binding domain